MKRPFASKRLFGPFVEIAGRRDVGLDPADEFSEMFESFTIVLEYTIVTNDDLSREDIERVAYNIEESLNEYLFSPAVTERQENDILYFMRADGHGKKGIEKFTLAYGIDGDIWESRLSREGKNEGSLGGTENHVNANMRIDGAVRDSYLFIYPTKVAQEIKKTGTFEGR